MEHTDRRHFLKTSLVAGAATLILPRSLFAGKAGSLVQIAQIGCGRMGTGDYQGTMEQYDLCRIVAVCDLDSKRAGIAKNSITQFYQKKGESQVDIKVYHDYKEVLARPDIDAVIVSVPDHQHAVVAISAILAGKDVYVQKPMTYTIEEAKALRTVVRAKNRILQTGSQQRSENPFPNFRIASEAVRNGRIGELKTVKIGIGLDKLKGVKPVAQTPPSTFDYDRWLGPAPEQPYIEDRVHPQDSISGRPGWITTEDFGLGMITNWGAHHIDIAQWAMGMELSGPVSIDAKAGFMKDDVWTVHDTYHVELIYPNKVQVILDEKFPNGISFEGTEGQVFCSRGAAKVTASDGNGKAGDEIKALSASKESILSSRIGPEGKIWMPSPNHYRNWLESIISRKDPIAPVDQGARSMTTCGLSWIGMKLNRKLRWDPVKEQFINDSEANAMRWRKARKPEYDVHQIMKNAGFKYKA
ncbi:Gfo/Idh/MocA family oxidoreductase [Hufsiella ginkgonis]|uniref:Gfo/Idh/MocA family oxidoreductase n=1 Tax=Hufsiella ginkgonis TaxID=2695274 RepID=A0A7K1Y2B2_9SPHI|nr:Gfo/Idh/MocA family oxidoreductase [Hufsiella ginkgonis]MXV16816.1 Gfo/Idh/MocA family oxidoreductase [Hufsiella ginkgonis]